MTKAIQNYTVTCTNMDWNYRMRPTSAPGYFQDCFVRYASSKHFAPFDLASKGQALFIIDYDIEFTEELPFWSERFDVITSVSKVTNARLMVDAQFVYKSEIFAKGKMTWVLYDTQSKRLLSTLDLCTVSGIEQEPLLEKEWTPIQSHIPQDLVQTYRHTVSTADLDFNGHVNNMAYIRIALSTSSKDWQQRNYLRRLAVKFQHQAFLGDTLEVTSYHSAGSKCFITNISCKGKAICQIHTEWEEKSDTATIAEYPLESRTLRSVNKTAKPTTCIEREKQ